MNLPDCRFFGSAITPSFAANDIEALLAREGLLPARTGPQARAHEEAWAAYRRKLKDLGAAGGPLRVRHHVLDPLAAQLGYGGSVEDAGEVATREREEDGGVLYRAEGGAKLRAWALDVGADLDAPSVRGRAYRFSPARVAERVLLACGERAALLSNGDELRLVLVDPARPGSHVEIALGERGGWRGARTAPDSWRLVVALASPAGVAALARIADEARHAQTRVTKSLRKQARTAVEAFAQAVLDERANEAALRSAGDRAAVARRLWREGLVVVYRLLFTLKLESSADPARAFSFASTPLWRDTYSPSRAMGELARKVVEENADTGGFLEHGLRATFRLFQQGLSSSELKVSALGGMLFGAESAPMLDSLRWTERGVANLLWHLLWTDGPAGRERVHYGSLDVEDLGRVYEALLELEPGISERPMCRLRRAKLEVVVDAQQGAPYRRAANTDADGDEAEEDEAEEGGGRAKTRVTWVEDIPADTFYLRVGLGRKATGSYYTPHPFVRFLVQETLAPQVAERSPENDPRPADILKLKVLDPAMGSGHFLVEACRFLGDKLYEACRLCDERAAQDEANAAAWRARVEELPDPNDELLAYLPSRAVEGEESGLSQSKALALCRRLVAVHCLYGVDKNPLAVELAKVSLWLESYAEGLPLTFLDHRLVCGDSLTGPFFEQLLTYPGSRKPLEGLFVQGLRERLISTLADALGHVRDLEESVGKDVADVERKRAAKSKLDAALAPFHLLARAWSGGVMLGEEGCDDPAYEALLSAVAERRDVVAELRRFPGLKRMVGVAADALSYDVAFPEIFHPGGAIERHGGFDAVVSNPPWDKPHVERLAFVANVHPEMLDDGEDLEAKLESVLNERPSMRRDFDALQASQGALAAFVRWHVGHIEAEAGTRVSGHVDSYHAFVCRSLETAAAAGRFALMLGGGFAKNPAAKQLRHVVFAKRSGWNFYHFDNRRRLFGDLPAILEFSLFVGGAAPRDGRELVVRKALQRYEDLETAPERRVSRHELEDLLARGSQLSIGELATPGPVGQTRRSLWAAIREAVGPLVQEVNTSAASVLPLNAISAVDGDPRRRDSVIELMRRGALPIISGRGFRDFDGFPTGALMRWSPVPDQVALLSDSRVAEAAHRVRYFRIAARRKCGSPKSNERSMRAAILPPGLICNDGVLVEADPWRRSNARALALAAVLNAFAVDARLRPKVQVMLGNAILEDTAAPDTSMPGAFLAHAAVRLSCVAPEYRELWREQLGTEWREPAGRRPTFPVLAGDEERWKVRAAIDAIVADAYGLDRSQYEDVLSSFTHRSYPEAPRLCLERFDELKRLGVERFCRKHDPYWDVPLVETLPTPVIDLSIPDAAPGPVAAATRRNSARSRGGSAAQESQLGFLPVQLAAEPETNCPRRRPGRRGAPQRRRRGR